MLLSRNDSIAWDKFLDGIAVEVNKLIIKNDNLRIFQNKISPFAQKWEKHKTEIRQFEQERNNHWQKVKTNPRLRDKNAEPPNKGWQWDPGFGQIISQSELVKVDYNLDGIAKTEYIPNYPRNEMPARLGKEYIEAVQGYITKNERLKKKYPPRSVDYQNLQKAIDEQRENIAIVKAQIKGLKQKQISSIRIVASGLWWRYLDKPDDEFLGCWRPPQKKVVENPLERLTPLLDTDKLPPIRDKTEEYERYYITLASIHDNRCSSSQSITKDIWPEKLAEDIWYMFSNRQPLGPDRPFITVALNRVRADLEKDGQSNGGKVDSPNEKSSYSLFWRHHWKWIIGTSIALIAFIWSIINT